MLVPDFVKMATPPGLPLGCAERAARRRASRRSGARQTFATR